MEANLVGLGDAGEHDEPCGSHPLTSLPSGRYQVAEGAWIEVFPLGAVHLRYLDGLDLVDIGAVGDPDRGSDAELTRRATCFVDDLGRPHDAVGN